jgi:hypothetical protein
VEKNTRRNSGSVVTKMVTTKARCGTLPRPESGRLTGYALCGDDGLLSELGVEPEFLHDLPGARPHADACADFLEFCGGLVDIDDNMW